jgi:acyl-homoserine lactone acylase PvdQ
MKNFFPLAQRCFVTCFAVIAYSECGLSQSESTLLPRLLELSGKTDREILWDQYGIPHIYGPNLLAVVRGYGYSQVENHAELVLQKTAEARGRTAEYFGPGTQNANVDSDIRIQTYGIPALASGIAKEDIYSRPFCELLFPD